MWINYAHEKVDLDILQALADINDGYPWLEIKRLKRWAATVTCKCWWSWRANNYRRITGVFDRKENELETPCQVLFIQLISRQSHKAIWLNLLIDFKCSLNERKGKENNKHEIYFLFNIMFYYHDIDTWVILSLYQQTDTSLKGFEKKYCNYFKNMFRDYCLMIIDFIDS